MKRIMVASGRRLDIECLRSELGQERGTAYELFLLYAIGGRYVREGLLHTSRYWRARYSELDEVLAEFARRGVLCDGVATTDDPVEAIGRTLREFQPDEVLIARTRRLRPLEERLRRLLQAYVRDSGRRIRTRWLPA